MVHKAIKTTLFASILAAVVCAGTASTFQLRTGAKAVSACRGTCSSTSPCATGCICAFPLESTTGSCMSHPTGVQSPQK
jgi:hypothetical protein